MAVASKVQSGAVWVNKWLDMPFDVPFRGAKSSGIGAENGQEGLEEYTQARIVNVALWVRTHFDCHPGEPPPGGLIRDLLSTPAPSRSRIFAAHAARPG